MKNDKNNIDLSKRYLSPFEAEKIAANLDAIERARNPEYSPLSAFVMVFGISVTCVVATIAFFMFLISAIMEEDIVLAIFSLIILSPCLYFDYCIIKSLVSRFKK